MGAIELTPIRETSQLIPGLAVQRFEYTRVGEQLGLLRLVARIARDVILPTDSKLVVNLAEDFTSHPACACRTERSSSGLLWHASFALPLEVAEFPHALFELVALPDVRLILPRPKLNAFATPDLAELRSGLFGSAYTFRRLAMIATALSIGAGSNLAASAAVAGTRHDTTRGRAVPASSVRRSSAMRSPSHQSASFAQIPTRTASRWHLVSAKLTTEPQRRSARLRPVRIYSAPAVHRTRHGAGTWGVPAPTRGPSTPSPAPPGTPSPADPGTPSLPPAATPPAATPPAANRPASSPSAPLAVQHLTFGAPKSQAGKHQILPVEPKHSDRPPATPHANPPSPPPFVQTPATDPDELSPMTSAPPSTFVTPTGTTTLGHGGSSAHNRGLSRLSWPLPSGNQPPVFLIPIYKAASRRYDVPWRVLAAINSIETSYGRNLNVSSAGAIGWMQFMPGTWRAYAVSATGHASPNPYNPADAIFSAANYLAANGASHDLRRAIFAYNHADWYVNEVLSAAQLIRGSGGLPVLRGARQKVRAMTTMADLLIGKPYVWGGGHGDWQIATGYDCSGFVSAVLHAAGYLDVPQTTETLPSQAGIKPGPGQYVTIFDRTGAGGSSHVIIEVNGRFYESGGSAGEGGGAGVKKLPLPGPDYLASFNTILHPAGL